MTWWSCAKVSAMVRALFAAAFLDVDKVGVGFQVPELFVKLFSFRV